MDTPGKPPGAARPAPDDVSGASHESVLRSREDAVTAREAADRVREDAASLREDAVRAREEAAQSRAEREALAVQIREANEHLVIANLRSQALAEEADRANRLKDEFIAMVSHELRTPLNAVLGWTRLLASKQLPEDRERLAVVTIERNAAALSLIIDDLLDLSRVMSGTLRLSFSAVDLVAVAREACDAVGPAAAGRRIHLTFSTGERPDGIVNGDAARLRQAIENLLSNAIKFTPEGGRVSVCVERAGDEGDQMEVRVADNGRGISADFMPLLFERFRQSARSSPHAGLGLGLAITREIVGLHGGTVHAASEGEGRGATFTIRLPIPAAGPARPAGRARRRMTGERRSPEPPQGLPQPHAGRLDGLHILVVDDDPDGLALTSLVLRDLGASVRAVTSARDALRVLEAERPDVLISDIGMPEDDGYALIDRIRRHEAVFGGRLPAVALTAHAGSTDRRRILAAGFQAHVPKPFEPAALTAAIIALTQQASPR